MSTVVLADLHRGPGWLPPLSRRGRPWRFTHPWPPHSFALPAPPHPAQMALFFLPPPPAGRPIPQSLEDLEDQKRKKKKEKMGFGSISRVFARGKQRKSLDPGLFDGTAPDYYIEEDADW